MTTTFRNFKITSTYTGEKQSAWDEKNWNHHNVSVYNTVTQQRTRFYFWASIAQPTIETENDLLNAFYCFVTDAIAGMDDFNEFCSNFGYDTDSRQAEKTWKSCKRSAKKLERISDVDIYDLANELSEAF